MWVQEEQRAKSMRIPDLGQIELKAEVVLKWRRTRIVRSPGSYMDMSK